MDYEDIALKKIKELQKQNDGLVEACKDIVNWEEARRHSATQDPAIVPKSVVCKLAEAALAEAEKEG